MLATTLRVLVYVLPILLAVATTILLGRVLPRPTTWWQAVLWWSAVVAGTLFVLVSTDHIFRRILPLAALFELSLVFPDRAPERFRVWRRGGSVAQLRVELETLTRQGSREGPEAAQRVLTLVAALAVHDPRTRGHAERVRILTDMIAEEMHLPDHDRNLLRWAALLHDIGKLEVPGEVLRKPGAPDDAEWQTLRRHPEEGDRLLGAVRGWLGDWAATVAHHHEHYDGNGYPRGLRGEEISLGGRIVGLADAFEAMTSRRSYSLPVSPVAAREELVRRAGTQFDPEVCRAFLNVSVGRLWRVVGLAAGMAQVPAAAWVARFGARVSPVGPGVAVSTGTVAVAGTLAAVVGLLPVVGVPATLHAAARFDALAGIHGSVTPPQGSFGVTLPDLSGTPASSPPGDATGAGASGAPASSSVASGVAGLSQSGGAPYAPAPAGPAAPGRPSSSLISVTLTVHPGSAHKGTAYAVSGSLSSCGGCTVAVDWGTGAGAMATAVSGNSFLVDHTYATKGHYLITVTVRSGGVLAGQATLRVVVNNG